MNAYALVNKSGFVQQIYTGPEELEENSIYNALEVHLLPNNCNPDEVLRNWYWDQNEWHVRSNSPGNFHFWNFEQRVWELNEQQLIAHYKYLRNLALQASDWTQLPDVPLTADQKQAWSDYRSALRNMTEDQYLEGNLPQIPDTMT